MCGSRLEGVAFTIKVHRVDCSLGDGDGDLSRVESKYLPTGEQKSVTVKYLVVDFMHQKSS